ncbi:MAG: hypothetical protein KJ747_02100 [Actinobacteria bacterium]|nr:hypothetical protein [Actinomycetota bacterium]MCG2806960.1 hypothetical protein [Coriobacteriia bacterium]
MPTLANIRRLSAAMTIIIAMVAVLLPLCMMVGCGMGFSEMMDAPAFGVGVACVNAMGNVAQVALAAGNPQSLILLMVAVLGAAVVLFAPLLTLRQSYAAAEFPPDAPRDPLGVRLIV